MEWHLGDRDKRAHPRSRGENRGPFSPHGSELGSSPLTRGKPVELQTGARLGGLIPAHAGKTRNADGRPAGHWAHPRSRGENGQGSTLRRSGAGSSPLTRGKQLIVSKGGKPYGLIPAHAGKTRRCPGHHRRARGSSPLTRGKLVGHRDEVDPFGLIPAHAGKTNVRTWCPSPGRAHPRSRGENPKSAQARIGS